jgi:hypothetical protein
MVYQSWCCASVRVGGDNVNSSGIVAVEATDTILSYMRTRYRPKADSLPRYPPAFSRFEPRMNDGLGGRGLGQKRRKTQA